MKKRTFERVPSNITVRFNCGNNNYTGTVTDLSENGMHIRIKKMFFPCESKFNVVISDENTFLHVPTVVKRITRALDSHDGLGLAVINAPNEYISFVNRLKNGGK